MSPADAVACMGGACAIRESCARYHAPFPARRTPFERLCNPPKFLMYMKINVEASKPVNRYIQRTFPSIAGTFPPFKGGS